MNRADRLAQDNVKGEPILFYRPRDAFGCLSQFSSHSVALPHPWTGEITLYKSGEHRFQAMKATCIRDHDYVASAATSYEAKTRGGPRGILLRPDWGNSYHEVCWWTMFEVCIAKSVQHSVVAATLRKTEGSHIYEDSPKDDIWGWRFEQDHRGKNLLGRAWMETRFILS